jgi:chromosome segregation ATPase
VWQEVHDKRTDKEILMAATHHEEQPRKYTSPPWAQRWFLERSRALWKEKYMGLKADAKRLQNRVNDVTKSRENWREQAKQKDERIRALETENAALQEQLAALKKDRPATDA